MIEARKADKSTCGMAAAKVVCIAVVSLSLFSASASAGPREDSAVVRKALNERFPDIQIEKIEKSPWLGLYEVFTPTEIVYSDSKGGLLFVGKIVETASKTDLTAKRWNDSLRIDFDSLPFDKAIKIVKGDGSRKLAVFEDPLCPYCERFEHALEHVSDTTVYVFLFPIEDLHPQATKTAVRIWCSPDRAASWQDLMLRKIEPAAAECASNPVAELAVLGERIKINVTPTLFFTDGTRHLGVLDKDQLERQLAERVVAK